MCCRGREGWDVGGQSDEGNVGEGDVGLGEEGYAALGSLWRSTFATILLSLFLGLPRAVQFISSQRWLCPCDQPLDNKITTV
ncbi:hypothetical protein E2C01_023041 [Portunus trituberculatus]|uniref:Uncharacterized protein n=1 Tax=Portunus trituberculatus TaxID=210409 RepID=A0A5B7EA43_PORTR|nr:hypothetical protein [Portunus trituberculatus]